MLFLSGPASCRTYTLQSMTDHLTNSEATLTFRTHFSINVVSLLPGILPDIHAHIIHRIHPTPLRLTFCFPRFWCSACLGGRWLPSLVSNEGSIGLETLGGLPGLPNCFQLFQKGGNRKEKREKIVLHRSGLLRCYDGTVGHWNRIFSGACSPRR